MPQKALMPLLLLSVMLAQPLLAMAPSTASGPAPRVIPPGTVVLFDEAHFPVYTVNPDNPSGYASGNRPRGAYEAYASVLQSAGLTVRTLDYGYYLDSNALSGVKVLVVVCSQGQSADGTVRISYTDEEVAAVVDFVRNGGGLFLIGDHTTFPPAIFPIAEEFGIGFAQRLLRDPDDYVENTTIPVKPDPGEGPVFIVFDRDNFNDHPIMANITRIELYRTDIFTQLPADAEPLITSDNDTYILDDFGLQVEAPRSIVSAVIPSGGTAGAGRVAVVADTNTFETDENRDDDDDMDLFDSHNSLYGLQIVEWLASVPEHYGVSLSSAEKETMGRTSVAKNCTAGANCTFYIRVANAGNVLDSYDLKVDDDSSSGWKASLSSESLTISSADARILTLNVSVPQNAPVGSSCLFRVEARSGHDPLIRAAVNCTIDIPIVRNITLTCAQNRKQVGTGDSARFELLLSNRGNVPESILVAASGPPGWACALELASLELEARANRTFWLTVTPPADALGGTEAKVVAAATLADLPGAAASAETYTKLIQSFGVVLSCPEPVMGVDPGSLVSFPVMVTNTGNGDDEVALSLVGGSRWSTYLEPSRLSLPHNSTVQAAVAARAPAQAPANETLELRVLGASVLRPSARSDLNLTAVVNRMGKFVLELEPYYQYADPGTAAKFNVTVANIGNAPERVLLSAPSPAWLSLDELEVRPGEVAGLSLSYPVAIGEQAWVEHYIELGAASAYNSSLCDSATAVVVVNQLHRLGGELSPDRLALLPGEEGNVSILLRNEGNGPEVAIISVDGHPPGWKAEADPPLANLDYKGALQGTLIVDVLPRAPAGPYDLAVNITDGTGASLLLHLEVEVLRVHNFTASVRPAVRTAAPGKQAAFTLALENLGNSPEQVRLLPNGSRASWVSPALELAILEIYGGNETELLVRSRPDAAPGKYNLSLLAIGEDNATRRLFFTLVVRESSVSTGDLPCIVAALLIALASAAVYMARKRAIRAQERVRPEGTEEAAKRDGPEGAGTEAPPSEMGIGDGERPGRPPGESPLIEREP